MWPQEVQEQALAYHGDLYERRGDFAALRISQGTLNLQSLLDAPFGLAFELDARRFLPVDAWHPSLLDLPEPGA
jgi:hypothetical protein